MINKDNLYEYFHTMIHSSAKEPKYMSISTVRAADILGVQPSDIEQKKLNELVSDGRLVKSQLQDHPHNDIYMLPSTNSPS